MPATLPPASPFTILPVDKDVPEVFATFPEIPAEAKAAPQETQELLLSKIRCYPNFPKEGVLFRDITTLVRDADALRYTVDILAARYRSQNIRYFVGVESRGFVFATALAVALGTGCVLLRKPGKLPGTTISRSYDLEYGQAELQLQTDAINKGDRVVVVDDLLATGGTLEAGMAVLTDAGAEVAEACVIIELLDLGGRAKIEAAGWNIFALAQCHEE